jgi:hypothetical protein
MSSQASQQLPLIDLAYTYGYADCMGRALALGDVVSFIDGERTEIVRQFLPGGLFVFGPVRGPAFRVAFCCTVSKIERVSKAAKAGGDPLAGRGRAAAAAQSAAGTPMVITGITANQAAQVPA